MSSVNAGDHKQRFKNAQPDSMSQAEFVAHLLDVYEVYDTTGLDVDAFLDRLEVELVSQVELAAYRGSSEALEEHHEIK